MDDVHSPATLRTAAKETKFSCSGTLRRVSRAKFAERNLGKVWKPSPEKA
jgi:hypothetical protein